MTPEQELIIKTLEKSLLPQEVNQAEEEILNLRKSPNYLSNLIDILSFPLRLSNDEDEGKSYRYNFSQEVMMCILIEIQKNVYRSTNEPELKKIKENMLEIILRLSNKGTYKQIKKIVKYLTFANLFAWFNVNECIHILESNSNREYFIQSLIGIVDFNFVDEPKFVVMDIYEVFTYLIEKLTTFKPSEIPSVFEYIQKYISIFPKTQIETFTSTILPFYISVSSTMYEHTKCIEDKIRESSYLSIKFIHKTFVVWIKKCIDNGLKELIDIWKEAYVIDFFKNSIAQIYHNPSPQMPKQEGLEIAEQLAFFLPKFFRLNSHIDWNGEIQLFLYHSIPKVLFQLTDIILIGNESIGYDDLEENVNEARIKNNILQFWLSLSCSTQKDPEPQPVSRPIFNNTPKFTNQKKKKTSIYRTPPPEPQPQKILTSLSGFPLHFKFIFQKLASSPTIFSPYIIDKSLKQKDPFQSSLSSSTSMSTLNPKWTIVILNILQAMKPILQTIKDDNIIKCIPSILPVYILPMLKCQSWRIRVNALSLIATYSEDFRKLRLGTENLAIFERMLNNEEPENNNHDTAEESENDNDEEDESCEKEVLLRVLPLLARNPCVSKLVEANLHKIITDCFEYTKESDLESTSHLLLSLNQILTKYKDKLAKPDKYIEVLIQQLISHTNTPYPPSPSPYTKTSEYIYCILSLIRTCAPSNKLHPALISPMRKLLFLLPHHTFLRTDIFRLISEYIYNSCKTNTFMMTIYAAICSAVSFWDNEVLGMLPGEVQEKVMGIKSGLEVEGEEEILIDKIWLMHMFSLKIKMQAESMTLKTEPINIYIESFYKCVLNLNKNNFKEVEPYSYFEIINMVLKSLICLFEKLVESETTEEFELNVIRTVWKLAVQEVWNVNIRLFNLSIRQLETKAKGNENEKSSSLEGEDSSTMEQVALVKTNFIRVFGLMLDFNLEITLSHINCEPQLLQNLLQTLSYSSEKELCTLAYLNSLTFIISSLICSEPNPNVPEEQIEENEEVMLKILLVITSTYIVNNEREFLGFEEVWLEEWEDEGFGYEENEFEGVYDLLSYDFFKYKEVNLIEPDHFEIKNIIEYLRDNKEFIERNSILFQQVCEKWAVLEKQINFSFSLDRSDSPYQDEEGLVDHFGTFKFD